ncbi:F0F1 ATP synthase subunit delta [Nitrosomonas sp.]|uniref:F0F1 ATP synthase subunit delta n=1 Tax=Nitrosomonas sp. TaxID=42353 RepID=UPI0025F3508B|nr:F0F1 ATP synthase subunit delta [Nitrosomonas sp.]MCC6915946.1 F0F1 ATP synthase subunit delta [Nitrosomonas sp.]
MAEAITIARPYAEAVFKLARESGSLFSWSETLDTVNSIVQEPQIKGLINNPQISAAKLCEIILSVGSKKISDDGKRLVSLLIDNRRLLVLPQICDLFEQFKAQHEGVLEAEIESAFPLDSDQVAKLVSILEAKFQRKVKADISVKSELIGGIRVKIGDQIIDSSVHGKLEAMATALKS